MTITSPEEFIRLRASDEPEEYRRAGQEDAPLSVWRELIDSFPEMRVWVARNKTVPVSILSTLSLDPDPLVRSAVADKRKAGVEILSRLAQDSEESVRLRVARNRKAPRSVLGLLAEDEWDEVRSIARKRLAQD
ncbi:hypothetical protein GCM10020366_24020 [Saccharopolyspora gregorii]|uniref:HEAT repeat domain-containing protein n=1 Tax=Saccharopolyspora gregorii TaxID=33914 RepID=A0ABP6RQR5_9PSEU